MSNPPSTIENLEHLLAEGGFSPRFNVIKKRIEIRHDDGFPASMNEIASFAQLHGYGTNWLYSYVDEIAARRPYNPVGEWISSKPWDGVDRLEDLYRTVRERPDYPPCLKKILLYRWLLSLTAAAISDKRFRTRGVLTLQGPQAIGKTSWIAVLLPAGLMRNEFVKLDHHLDPANKDSVLGAVSHLLVEIGELDSSFKKDVARLKGFLTSDCDKLRRPYGRDESEYDRRTVFAATVNEETFLVDATGNSRWYTIAVDGLDFDHQIDMQQVHAQLAVDLKAGAQWWLTQDEERQLAAYNRRHRSVSAIAERIRDYIDPDMIGDPNGIPKTAIEVLSAIGISNPTNVQCKEAGAALRELIGSPRRINGRDRWRITIKRDPKLHRLNPAYDPDDEY
jgi:putative DNA primase/helicase